MLNLAVLLAEKKEFEKAGRMFDEIIAIQPRFYKAHWGAAEIAMTLGNIEKARRHYQTVLELEPNHPDARKRLEQIDRRANR
jgi:tetratricopeptide (TPR) repeat protein